MLQAMNTHWNIFSLNHLDLKLISKLKEFSVKSSPVLNFLDAF